MREWAGPGRLVVSLCQMTAVRARSRLGDACYDSWFGASAVAFEMKMGFEGVVDRLDDLTERFEEPGTRSGLFFFGGRSNEGHACLVEILLEGGAAVPFVGHRGLTLPGHATVGEHPQTGVTFVCRCGSERPR